MKTVLFVVPCGSCLPSGTVRVQQFLPFLDHQGIRSIVVSYFSPAVHRFVESVRDRRSPGVIDSVLLAFAAAGDFVYKWSARVRILWLASSTDVVFLQGVLPPVWYMRLLMRRNPRTVLDLDDAIYLGNPARGRAVVAMCWQVIAGSHEIYGYASELTSRVVLVPSGVSTERYVAHVNVSTGTDRVMRIGWLGSTSTLKYLSQLAEPLRQLAAEGHRIELLIAGAPSQSPSVPVIPGVSVTCVPSYVDQDIPEIVSRYDIGVMPLEDGPWERAKCAMKALIYMAAGTPAICSRVGENSYVIEDGVNGFLAESESEWTTKLRALINDPQLRAQMGRQGRKTVEARYSSQVCFDLLNQHVFSRVGSHLVASGDAS